MSNIFLSRAHKKNEPSSQKPHTPSGYKRKKQTFKRIGWGLFFAVSATIFCSFLAYLYIIISGEQTLKSNIGKMKTNRPSKVYDRNNNYIGELSLLKSEPADSEEIPDLLKSAFIATEDRRFYEHPGVDLLSVGRAIVEDLRHASLKQGGSTLTQQLARNVFLSSEKTFLRKATEMSIAMALERNYTKDQIIQLYLNKIFFGHGCYGVKAASSYYFGITHLKELKLWQIATLAAMPKGPSKYNPISDSKRSKERRKVVLDLMYEQKFITKEQRDEANKVEYNYTPPKHVQKHIVYMDYVLQEAQKITGKTKDELHTGGYQIYTYLDQKAQTQMERVFSDERMFEKSRDNQIVQGAMIIMNHEEGSIVALHGGRNYKKQDLNRATQIKRQPGSSFKPIVSFAPALESGKFDIHSTLSNEKQCFGKYCPNNLDRKYFKGMSMREAITNSANIPAVWTLQQIGVKTGYRFAKSLGISLTEGDRNLSIALGGLEQGTNVLEMARAYSTFANLGQYQEAYCIKKIENINHNIEYEHKPERIRVMSEKNAYIMTQLMQDVIRKGTGKTAQLSRPLAGKTGTTQSGLKGLENCNRDIWFVGYTPEWTGAVWMGYDRTDSKHVLRETSNRAATFFRTVMEPALKGVPVKTFKKPADIDMSEFEVDLNKEETVVRDLTATYSSDQQSVQLTWQSSKSSNVKYRVYRKESSQANYSVVVDGISACSTPDLSVLSGLTYEYYVVAYTKGEECKRSNVVKVTTTHKSASDRLIFPEDANEEWIDPVAPQPDRTLKNDAENPSINSSEDQDYTEKNEFQ